jgi:hypothetical protein
MQSLFIVAALAAVASAQYGQYSNQYNNQQQYGANQYSANQYGNQYNNNQYGSNGYGQQNIIPYSKKSGQDCVGGYNHCVRNFRCYTRTSSNQKQLSRFANKDEAGVCKPELTAYNRNNKYGSNPYGYHDNGNTQYGNQYNNNNQQYGYNSNNQYRGSY